MRIHELLEACLDYVTVEGVLGADPRLIRDHLQTLELNVDDAYFAHLWTLLAAHSSVQVVIANDVLPGPEGVDPSLWVTSEGKPLNTLFTFVGEDDGGEPPIKRTDLRGLLERYPQRVRMRCTDDEIYYRLTGSRKKIPRITPMIFTYLQLAARSREKGISALELGPMTDSNQKSVYHYIKVLTQLGLCAKVPASLHGANTSILVFRKFLDQNPNYRAHMHQTDGEYALPALEETDDGKIHSLGFNFTPFSELELTAGHIPKERLLRVLDHPGLKNHLLGNHHLLSVLGWPEDDWQTRHRRQLQRHISALVDEGVVEYVDIGNSARACLRLTKYNPQHIPIVKKEPTGPEDAVEDDIAFNSEDYTEPFQFFGGAVGNQMVECQVLNSVQASGVNGRTIADLYTSLSGMFKRTLEHIVNRQDLVFLPPNLRHRGIRCVIESHLRERRLRIFTTDAYAQYSQQLGITIAPQPDADAAGQFADLSYRSYADTAEKYLRAAAKIAAFLAPIGALGQGKGRPHGAKTRNYVKRQPSTKKRGVRKEKVEKEEKGTRYTNDVQERGRPRKYIYVVTEAGVRSRTILGDLLPQPDMPTLLIYVKDEDVLVPAPAGYSGVGQPPTLTEEQVAAGKPPEFYLSRCKSKGGKNKRAPATKRKKAAAEGEDEAGPSKKPRRKAAKGRGKKQDDDELDELEDEEGGDARAEGEAGEAVGEQHAVETDGAEMEAGAGTEAPPAEPETTATGRPKRGRKSEVTKPIEAPAPKRPRRGRKAEATAVEAADATAELPPVEGSGEGTSSQAELVQAPKLEDVFTETASAKVQAGEAPPMDVDLDILDASTLPAEASDLAADAAAAALEAGLDHLPEDGMHSIASAEAGTSTPLRQIEGFADTPLDTPLGDEEPLRSIEDEKPEEKPKTGIRQRVDLSLFKRANEVEQCLKELGGIYSDHKLWHEHRLWATRHAGTDHPFAPSVAVGMDRKVFKRALTKLLNDGRIKERIATLPTTTGRWIRMNIYYITGTDDALVQSYIRELANAATSTPSTPVATARSKPALEYSAYKRPAPRSSHIMLPPTDSPTPAVNPHTLTKREIYLMEPHAMSYLLGFQSGRALRTKTLHRAIIEALQRNPISASIVSSKPRIVAIPFIFEEITVRDFLACIQLKIDEDLYQWLQNPGHMDLRLCQLPKEVAERLLVIGSKSSGTKGHIRTLLAMLAALQVITALAPVGEDVATVHASGDPGATGTHPRHFEPTNVVSKATYFLIHDFTPIYNIAEPSMPLLGFMPSKNLDDLEDLWSIIKMGSLKYSPHIARREIEPWPYTAHYSGVLSTSSNLAKSLQSSRRWRNDVPMDKAQRNALNATVGSDGSRTVTDPADVSKLAYENALPPAFVESYLQRRRAWRLGEEPLDKIGTGVRQKVVRDRMREREVIREELSNRIRSARQIYDQRVRSAAAAAGVEVTPELLDYIVRNRPMARLGEIASDADLRAIIESYVRVQNGYEAPRRAFAGRSVTSIRAAKRPGKRPADPNQKIRRHRHNWTKDEEELLMDAEAVIRARARENGTRGRQAMSQVFPEIGSQVLRTRLKKILETIPGRQAYYNRLEDATYEILQSYRGTPDLPDPNPMSIIDFDLPLYIDFVRTKINKNLLRIPTSTPAVGKAPVPSLPSTSRDVVRAFEWTYIKPIEGGFEALMDNLHMAEESRVHSLAVESIVEDDPKVKTELEPISRREAVIRAMLKMIVSTPDEVYSMKDASNILSMPKEEYEPQIAMLVNEGVLNKTLSRTPGRMYSFSVGWLEASDGILPPEISDEMSSMYHQLGEGPMVYPIMSKSGDLAALATMVSNNEIDIDFDIDDIPSLRGERRWYNTRSLTDQSIEFDISITRTRKAALPANISPPDPLAFPRPAAWPETRPVSAEQIDKVLEALATAGVEGMQRGTLQVVTELPLDVIDGVLGALSREDEARVFWAGYDNARLVLAPFWFAWSVSIVPRQPGRNEPIPDAPSQPCAPRRWVDIWGAIIRPEWERAVRAVLGHLTLRPGMTEHTLRARVAPILDRMETSDVLQYLTDAGIVERKVAATSERVLPPVHATDAWEGHGVVYVPTSKMWVM